MGKKLNKAESPQIKHEQPTPEETKQQEFVADVMNLAERKERLALNKNLLEGFGSELNKLRSSINIIIGLSEDTRQSLNLASSKLGEALSAATDEVRKAGYQTNLDLQAKLNNKS